MAARRSNLIAVILSTLGLCACTGTGFRAPVPRDALTAQGPRVRLLEGAGNAGVYRLDGASIAYEYDFEPGERGRPGALQMRFELQQPPSSDGVLRLLVHDGRRSFFTHRLYSVDEGTVVAGRRRTLEIEPYESASFSIVATSGGSLQLPRDGIVLQPGENIAGTYEWVTQYVNVPMYINYTYSFRPGSGQVPGQLDMAFELVNGQTFNELGVDLVIADREARAISGGLLFERRRREFTTDVHRQLRMDVGSAWSFTFVGGGFLGQGSIDNAVRPFPFPGQLSN